MMLIFCPDAAPGRAAPSGARVLGEIRLKRQAKDQRCVHKTTPNEGLYQLKEPLADLVVMAWGGAVPLSPNTAAKTPQRQW
ncbi:hypothetical protein [Shinella zoogloeoides]|uniref:hypothetical protein n=1 Tax=Shinella zoogloeoides TaxID=352475 RepID=UPI00299E00D8|nr:hypothetical protein [Shinella zoogloeoides]